MELRKDPNGGESESYRGLLKPEWTWLRWIQCSAASERLCPIWGCIYGIFGMSCRAEERTSFALVVTPTRIIYSQTIYDCGLCRKSHKWSETKYDDIEKVVVSTTDDRCCCGCCGDEVQVWKAQKKEEVESPKHRGCCCCPETPYFGVLCLRDPKAFQSAAERAKASYDRTKASSGNSTLMVPAQFGMAYNLSTASGLGMAKSAF